MWPTVGNVDKTSGINNGGNVVRAIFSSPDQASNFNTVTTDNQKNNNFAKVDQFLEGLPENVRKL